ncbi:MAG: replication-associated recombination protein A [Myxococcota bacterium]
MELFPRGGRNDSPESERTRAPEAPLAERMRPRTLEEFVGQTHLLGPEGTLSPVVDRRGSLPSAILFGPPGSGKTTLARLLAQRAGLRILSRSAVLSGVKDLREAVALAQADRANGVRTALFIDEIHRFNKAQQDALLPYVERGTVVLLGATTENPSFEIIPALRSRCRIFHLEALDDRGIETIVRRALDDPERGLGARSLAADDEALRWIVRLAEGDARRALSLLESAADRVETRLDRAAVQAALEAPLPAYDKAGEAHYDLISAFIKSLRGSDPDAALYWLVRMLDGGEDPRFIARRMLIFASEDVGNADPRGLRVAVDAAAAFDRVGLPEGRLILAQAATFLASAPKSDASTRALGAASAAVREHGSLPVPLALRNAPTEWMRGEGYGRGYVSPHSTPEHFVEAQYLPDRLSEAVFYEPSDQGLEASIGERLRRLWRRRAQR